MEKTVLTPRLKLTLLESVEDGSDELKWAHAVRSDELATSWSIFGVSKDTATTQAFMREHYLPSDSGENTKYRITYTIHKLFTTNSSEHAEDVAGSEVIGMIGLHPEDAVPINEDMTIKSGLDIGVLKLELGYLFLPTAWGKGYATEAVKAVLDTCRKAKAYFEPYNKLYVQAVVSPDNPGSMRVMEKAGVKKIGVNKWDGEPAWLAGGWRQPEVLIYGTWAFE